MRNNKISNNNSGLNNSQLQVQKLFSYDGSMVGPMDVKFKKTVDVYLHCFDKANKHTVAAPNGQTKKNPNLISQ